MEEPSIVYRSNFFFLIRLSEEQFWKNYFYQVSLILHSMKGYGFSTSNPIIQDSSLGKKNYYMM
jgi:hypothetical protein